MTSGKAQISLYKQSKEGLRSLFVQTTQVSIGLGLMLILTGGNPPGWLVSASFFVGIGFVALSESKRQSELEKSEEKSESKGQNQPIVINNSNSHQGNTNMSGDRNIMLDMGNYNERIEGNYYEQSGNFGIGHMSGGEIKENARIAGVINEAQQPNLAETAAEIQQLLDQLSSTYPTSTSKEKMAVVAEAVDRIESNPTFKARVVNALRSGGIEAFKEAIDRPLVNILVATIEGWQEAE
jgi:hypothetical protein